MVRPGSARAAPSHRAPGCPVSPPVVAPVWAMACPGGEGSASTEPAVKKRGALRPGSDEVFPGVGVVGVGVASRVVAGGSGTGRRRGLPAGARLEHLDVVDVAVLLELEAPSNDWFAGTVTVTRAKRGLCGKPSLAARGMFEARGSASPDRRRHPSMKLAKGWLRLSCLGQERIEHDQHEALLLRRQLLDLGNALVDL